MLTLIKKVVFFLIYLSHLWVLVRRTNRRKLIILMYHGISEDEVGVWTQVARQRFEQQMAYVSNAYRPVSLEKAAKLLPVDSLEDGSVAVTFDDGFRNNKTIALPILTRYRVPATIYVTTSFIGGESPFGGLIWTDYVFSLLLSADKENIDLSEYELGGFRLTDRRSRVAAKEAICRRFKHLSDSERKAAIGVLSERTGGEPREEELAVFQPMSWDEVREVADSELLTIGAHTVGHPILTRLPRERMIEEITASQAVIKAETDRPPMLFAYPNGTRDDFNEEIKAAVAELYTCAVSTIEGFNDTGTDLYELRRFGIGNDMPLWEFKLRLSGTVELFERILGRT
ncbi:polysaccharide deacetylase family protein [bacterium]|nr:polysaccharide deacetylase family protein [bacterium]